MDSKWICLFVIFLAAVMAMGSVGATDLETHEFGDYFSMKIPKNVHFEKDKNISHENGMDTIFLEYMSEDLDISYINNPIVTENSSEFFYQSLFESIYPELDECYEYQEGNLTILMPKKINDMHFPMVGTSSGNEIVIIMGKDIDMIKEMGKSVDFK
ncbi:MAG: hypothetical protein E7Z79_07150 [Methanobrevibacter thaueri]|uniref:Uncharacterized protein n=1 Tax=Methanobrevibacter thaueri TaxID=190975 RepID=A0A8T3VG05_9EURY|nr:hypothetical protein [Methanobrevibacter thaueri]MBE6502204.1 hypothetical protein [Methanobrevibacter thaueri]